VAKNDDLAPAIVYKELMKQPATICRRGKSDDSLTFRRYLCAFFMTLALCRPGPAVAGGPSYTWVGEYDSAQTVACRLSPPAGYRRVAADSGSFAAWLRGLPLKPDCPQVLSYAGRPIANQRGHWAVVDIDVGDRDLQQCADAIIRLRAEYLHSKNLLDSIHFNFTNGDTARYTRWIDGYRAVVSGNTVRWAQQAVPDTSYAGFRKYLDMVFTYAGTRSLAGEMKRVPDSTDIGIGDIFVIPGSPGHAVLVIDMAVHLATGKKLLVLAQGYMPAQDIHIVRNLIDDSLDPWHEWNPQSGLRVLLWPFNKNDLRRFK